MKIHKGVFAGRAGRLGPGDEEKLARSINQGDAERLESKGVITIEKGDEFTGNPDGGEKGPARRKGESEERFEARRSQYRTRVSMRKEPAEAAQDVSDLTKEELQAYADDFGIEVNGTGSGGNVLKGDLLKAIEAHQRAKG